MIIIDYLRSILLSLWLGAALFFSVAVAPNVFGVLRSFQLVNANEVAGTIVTRTLVLINVGGFVIGLFVLLITFALKKRFTLTPFVLQVLSLLVLIATTGIGQWIVAARMRALRVAMGTIDLVPAADPRHAAFTQLHVYSVGLLSAAMLASIVALVVIVVSRRRAS